MQRNINQPFVPAPSFNVSPGEISPIIVSARHFNPEAEVSDRVLVPALWGLIPRWHSSDYKKHGLTTNNARLETIASSKLYKPCLERGRRCVIPIEGFYEWSTVNPKQKSSERPAYYIYMKQEDGIKVEEKSTWSSEYSIRMMFVAGLFDVWHDLNGDSIQCLTVITFESDSSLSWLHHRTPAILETEEQIRNWLNPDYPDALKLIQHPKELVWHRVSNLVNNSRNKSPECNKPYVESSKQNTLLSWVKRKSDQSADNDTPEKKIKNE